MGHDSHDSNDSHDSPKGFVAKTTYHLTFEEEISKAINDPEHWWVGQQSNFTGLKMQLIRFS